MSSVALLSMGGCSQHVKYRVGVSGHSPSRLWKEGIQAKAVPIRDISAQGPGENYFCVFEVTFFQACK